MCNKCKHKNITGQLCRCENRMISYLERVAVLKKTAQEYLDEYKILEKLYGSTHPSTIKMKHMWHAYENCLKILRGEV